MGDHRRPVPEGRQHDVVEPVAEVGCVEQAEVLRAQRVNLLAGLDERTNQWRGVPLGADHGVAFALEPGLEQPALRGLARPFGALEGHEQTSVRLARMQQRSQAVVLRFSAHARLRVGRSLERQPDHRPCVGTRPGDGREHQRQSPGRRRWPPRGACPRRWRPCAPEPRRCAVSARASSIIVRCSTAQKRRVASCSVAAMSWNPDSAEGAEARPRGADRPRTAPSSPSTNQPSRGRVGRGPPTPAEPPAGRPHQHQQRGEHDHPAQQVVHAQDELVHESSPADSMPEPPRRALLPAGALETREVERRGGAQAGHCGRRPAL